MARRRWPGVVRASQRWEPPPSLAGNAGQFGQARIGGRGGTGGQGGTGGLAGTGWQGGIVGQAGIAGQARAVSWLRAMNRHRNFTSLRLNGKLWAAAQRVG